MARNVVPVTLGSPQFHTHDVGALRVTEALFPPHAELPLHSHDRPLVAIILDGSWDERMGGHAHDCFPGTVIVEPAEEKHTNRLRDAGARVIVVEPDMGQGERFEPCRRLLDEAGCFEDWGIAALARQLAVEINEPDDLSSLIVEGVALEILALATRRRPQMARSVSPVWIRRVRERLHAEFQQRPLLSDLAQTAGVHPMHLARVFRATLGMSVGVYVRQLRLDWSAEQLINTTTSLAQIASQAGYADQSHFTRDFRRHAGVTPRSYREARSRRRPARTEEMHLS